MDESYLDQLLKEVEQQNNDNYGIEEPSNPNVDETVMDEMPSALEDNINADAEHIQDVAWSDAEIPVDEISDLDALDDLADIDMNELDFDDIDFDDIEVTSMNSKPVSFQQDLEDIEDLKIDEDYLDESENQAFEQEFQQMKKEGVMLDSEPMTDSMMDTLADSMEDVMIDTMTDSMVDTMTDSLSEQAPEEESVSKQEDGFDVDALLQDVFGEDMQGTDTAEFDTVESSKPQQEAPLQENSEMSFPSESQSENTGTDDLDDLFAMLGIEGGSAVSEPIPETDTIPDFEIPEELADDVDISEMKQKKKKGFMEILFGDDEDDALTPEQEVALAKAKEEKEKAKQEKKEKQKEEKAMADAKKKSAKAQKTAQVAAKKAARKAADEKALAEDGPEKKLNIPLTIISIIVFLAIGGFVIVGTNVFDYTLVIAKASNYFERQKYGMAYREIIGVDVLEKDQPLEEKIYTVMYVERQYEAYENYVKMNRPDLALDALIQGLGKYDVYYEAAVELGIEDDINTARSKIVDALTNVFHMDTQEAYRLLLLDKSEYTKQIQEITGNTSFTIVEE